MVTMQTENITNETRLTRIQALVVEILNDLLRAPIEDTDRAIEDAIARIGTYCLRDRAYVFVKTGEAASNTHEWCAPGIEPMIHELQDLSWELYAPLTGPITEGLPQHIPDVEALPPESATRELLDAQQIRSILLVPMLAEGAPYGFVGFDGVERTHEFLPGELYLLQSVADVICSVLRRRESDRAVQAAQAALQGQRRFLESILSTSAMGLVVIDGDGIITFVNDQAEVVLGVTREEMINAHHNDPKWRYAHDDGTPIPAGETPFDLVLRTGQPVADFRWSLDCPDGLRYCSVHAAPVPEGGQAGARVVYAVVDVTAQVQSERARTAALEDARRANVAKSQFLAKMSHEMRTPLNGVLGIAEVLARLIGDPDQRRMVKVLHESGSLLLNIINDLLDMSKIEADQLKIEQVAFDFQDLARRVEDVHTLKVAEKHLSFGVSLLGQPQSQRLGDPHRLLQILHNVISNAVKFTQSGSVQVEIDCRDPASVRIAVTDTGIGMTETQLTQVFEEFGQADSTIARKFGGTGLGMPIVKRLVEMMYGTVTVQSRLNQGTRVDIVLPLPRVTSLPVIEPREPVDPPSHDLQGLRVLAADDNRTNRMILGAMLGQLGVSAVLVDDGPDAIQAWRREHFDAVILDISMPEMDGVSVMQTIRAETDERGRRVPILAFTANAMSHQVEAYLQAGFDDCLTKPLQLDRLRSALGATVAPPLTPAPSASLSRTMQKKRAVGG